MDEGRRVNDNWRLAFSELGSFDLSNEGRWNRVWEEMLDEGRREYDEWAPMYPDPTPDPRAVPSAPQRPEEVIRRNNVQEGEWGAYFRSVSKLNDITPEIARTFMDIYGYEGGKLRAGDTKYGIKDDTYEKLILKLREQGGPQIPPPVGVDIETLVMKPSTDAITLDEVAYLNQLYFVEGFKQLGGYDVLKKIPDGKTAAGVADVLFNYGTPGIADVYRRALKEMVAKHPDSFEGGRLQSECIVAESNKKGNCDMRDVQSDMERILTNPDLQDDLRWAIAKGRKDYRETVDSSESRNAGHFSRFKYFCGGDPVCEKIFKSSK